MKSDRRNTSSEKLSGFLTMGKKASPHQSAVAPELLNFHFASAPTQQREPQPRRPGGRNRSHDQQRYQRSEQDRTSARRKASSQMFPLHSSAYHAFALTRKSKQGYSFKGCDTTVSWESVRTVKYLAHATGAHNAADAQETCPICLDVFSCARITKCGHCFCLPCLMRHNHTSASENAAIGVKCPCCALAIHIDDIRPVVIESVLAPRVQARMKLVKLHRTKDCPAPYLPQQGQWKHSAPHAIPCMTNRDARFSRFTYIDPVAFQRILSTNHDELDRYARDLRHGPDLELLFVHMSQERIKNEMNAALQELPEEQSLMDRFSQNQSGVYQQIPGYLFASGRQNLTESQVLDDHSACVESFEDTEGLSSRLRGDSLCSETSIQRARGESFGSEGNGSGKFERKIRGYSIDSADSANAVDQKRRPERILPELPASLYLEENGSQFYQSVDGQLCFLSKFNMNCLATEFASYPPGDPVQMDASPNERRKRSPLPDEIDGIILEVETLHLTPEMRKRLPVFSHIPVYTDMLFVELDLNRILSNETKQLFKKESEKRKQSRKKRAAAEKNADQLQKMKEKQRIDALKSRMQRIDPTDDFFYYEPDPEPSTMMTGDQFGPSIGVVDAIRSPFSRPATDAALNFSAIVNTPSSMAMTQDAFPSLGARAFPDLRGVSSVPAPTPLWARGWHETNAAPKTAEPAEVLPTTPAMGPEKGKKSKSKEKVVLFSTGGQRGGL